jgi:hypothetical protein
MLSEDIMQSYYKMIDDPVNIPAATILIATSGPISKQNYKIIKDNFEEYRKTLRSNEMTRILTYSVYKALSTQIQILDNQEILKLLQACYLLVAESNTTSPREAETIYEIFEPFLKTKASDTTLLAKILHTLHEIFWATLSNRSASNMNANTYEDSLYYQRTVADSLSNISLKLNGLTIQLPEKVGSSNTIVDLYAHVVKTSSLPMVAVYLSEVATYQKFTINFYDDKINLLETHSEPVVFEVPYEFNAGEVNVLCHVYSYGKDEWTDTGCSAEIEDKKIRISTSKLGVLRILNVSEIYAAGEGECETNPAPYGVLLIWFGLSITLLLILMLNKMNKLTTYEPTSQVTTNRNLTLGLKAPEYSLPRCEVDINLQLSPSSMTIFKKNFSFLEFIKNHILVSLFTNSSPVTALHQLVSFLTSMILGYALLGSFVHAFGDSKDNSSLNFEDISEMYYPEDIKIIFLSLGLVIPVTLPLRILVKANRPGMIPVEIFTLIALIGSVLGVLLMGAYFCQGAIIRWTLSYLIFIPLELCISEFIIATVLTLACRR